MKELFVVIIAIILASIGLISGIISLIICTRNIKLLENLIQKLEKEKNYEKSQDIAEAQS